MNHPPTGAPFTLAAGRGFEPQLPDPEMVPRPEVTGAPAAIEGSGGPRQDNGGSVLNVPHGVLKPAPSILAEPYGSPAMYASP
jgi:hypothetical protein